MRPILTIVDDFLPNPDLVRREVLAQGFEDVPFEGTIYHTVNVKYQPAEIPAGLGRLFNRPINILVSAFREGRKGSHLHNLVHSDTTCASLASVLYLNPATPLRSGTAFWRHRATGWTQQPTDDQLQKAGLTIEEFCKDWHNPDAWDQTNFAEAQYNRLITYPTSLFHSRWPWGGFGDSSESARLIHCAFFNLV